MKIKVVFFIDSFRIGGMHKQILYLAKYIDRDKFKPIVCVQSNTGGLKDSYYQANCKIVSLDWTSRLQFGVFKRFISFLRVEQPDIIFITAPQNLFYYRVARIFYWGKTIQIGSFRAMNFWLGHLNKWYMPIDIFLSQIMILTSKRIVANSQAIAHQYIKRLPIIARNKMKVIYNGSNFDFDVTLPSNVLKSQLQFGAKEIVIVMIARLDPWKDFDTLLNAAKIVVNVHENARFLLVGDGELRTVIKEHVERLGLSENVFLIGERLDVYNYINLSDISVLSTRGEGFSNSILESMAFAKPVIATDVGGNAELLGRNSNEGFLVTPNSPKQLAETIIKLVVDEGLRTQVGLLAKEKIYKMCSLPSFVKANELLFIEVLECQV